MKKIVARLLVNKGKRYNLSDDEIDKLQTFSDTDQMVGLFSTFLIDSFSLIKETISFLAIWSTVLQHKLGRQTGFNVLNCPTWKWNGRSKRVPKSTRIQWKSTSDSNLSQRHTSSKRYRTRVHGLLFDRRNHTYTSRSNEGISHWIHR